MRHIYAFDKLERFADDKLNKNFFGKSRKEI